MHDLQTIITIISDILDRDPAEIHAQSLLIRELEAESIDLLEIGVAIGHHFQLRVDDEQLFLKNLRQICLQADEEHTHPEEALQKAYPHLGKERVTAILADMQNGPTLCIADLLAYVETARL